MSVEQNKGVVRRFYEELWNGRRTEVADELIAPGCVTHQLRSGVETESAARGPEAVKRHVAEWLAGFPDLHFEIEQMVAGEDEVVTRSVMRGTHTGTWLGLAPTGTRVSLRMMVIQRVVGGKIVADWVLVESLGLWQQLGLVPPTPEILARRGK